MVNSIIAFETARPTFFSSGSLSESLKKAVQGEGLELFVIGDALVPRNLSSAVHDGYRIGLRI